MTDPLTHVRKTIWGFDLSFGRTVTAGCGKRRPRGRTSTDPARVTCPDCRKWAAGEERELAEMARAAAGLARAHPDLARQAHPGHTAVDFEKTAREHDTRAAQWDQEVPAS